MASPLSSHDQLTQILWPAHPAPVTSLCSYPGQLPQLPPFAKSVPVDSSPSFNFQLSQLQLPAPQAPMASSPGSTSLVKNGDRASKGPRRLCAKTQESAEDERI
ncbi:hypothetical protein PCANC_13475 [Puccinia coronata f. sp. avenae]|uniref:Uncharacterized protein n=1 Tax=Puccinia coronata f. sp. avenae TaxID=200324 RepID=A0A2N5TRK8_9BASI|nr:hypothetical protein PCASD_23782 [Puccinia coronata f. sp. avenae]PLW44973.1 hypothetical protein PCANC_13475 [Puccinia coronata f. sp. avenae]